MKEWLERLARDFNGSTEQSIDAKLDLLLEAFRIIFTDVEEDEETK